MHYTGCQLVCPVTGAQYQFTQHYQFTSLPWYQIKQARTWRRAPPGFPPSWHGGAPPPSHPTHPPIKQPRQQSIIKAWKQLPVHICAYQGQHGLFLDAISGPLQCKAHGHGTIMAALNRLEQSSTHMTHNGGRELHVDMYE